jgi:parallel beta-helix repeat protein
MQNNHSHQLHILAHNEDINARIKCAVEMAKNPESPEALPILKEIASNKDEDIILRGYSAWAIEQINPRPDLEKGLIYHVAQTHPKADDNNPGTEELPWKTIQKSAESLRPGDTVIIHDGTYREFVRPFLGGKSYDRMITYCAATNEKPILKGSDEWNPKWKNEGNGLWSAQYYRHPWDNPESWTNPNNGPMHRAEQVFVDGKLLTHVSTFEELNTQIDSLFTDDESGRLWIHIDKSPSERFIERSMRQQIFAPAVRGLGYVRVQGLTMLHACAPESNGDNWNIIGHRAVMSVRVGHNWIIEDNIIEWGNAQGLDIGGEGWGPDVSGQPILGDLSGFHQVRRNRVNYNGVAGIVGWGGREQSLLIEDNETEFNCQKGNFYAYEAAGIKIHNAEDCILRRNRCHGNNAFGIWLDSLCKRNRVTQNILTENMGAGFFFEVSAGPTLADNNVIIGSRDAVGSEWGEGIYSHDGNNALYVNNFIMNCVGFGIRLRNLFDRDEGKTTTSHNRIYCNFLIDNKRGSISLNPEVPKAEDNHSDYNIFNSDQVIMRLEDSGSGVHWEDTPVGKKMNKSGDGNLIVSMQIWQEFVGNDRNSLVNSNLQNELTPEQIRQKLTEIWHDNLPALDDGYGDIDPQAVVKLFAALKSKQN